MPKDVFGPIYLEGTAKHNYVEPKKPDWLNTVNLRGPIYINDDYKHHFQAIQEHAESLKNLFFPVFGIVTRKHGCILVSDKPDAGTTLKAPIYAFGKIENQFAEHHIPHI